MNGIPTMHMVAAIVTGLYGLISLVGGTIGYIKASSVPSLVAGGIAGLLLILCAIGIPRLPTWSLGGAILISLLLVGRFTSTALKSEGPLSEFLSKGAGITAVVMIAGGLVVLVVAGLALATGAQPPAQS